MGKKKQFKRIYAPEIQRDHRVGYGKYAKKPLHWVVKNDPEYFKKIRDIYYDKYTAIKKRKYDELVKKHFTNSDLYRDKKDSIVNQFIRDKKQGMIESYSKGILKETYKDISEGLLNECFVEAKATIKKEFEIERDFLVDIHVLRYEELFLEACEPDLSKIPQAYQNQVLAESYYNAIEILTQKEKALGMHSKNFKLQINNFIQEKKKKEVQKINFDVLSLYEQCKLLRLIEATKANDVGDQQVIQSSTIEEVIKQSVSTIQIEAPIRQAKETDVFADEEAIEVKKQGKSLYDVQNSIKESLKRQVEDALRKRKK